LAPPEHNALLAMPLPAASKSHAFGLSSEAQLNPMSPANMGCGTVSRTQYTSASVGEASEPWIWISCPGPTVTCAVEI
jgi:hypothetical protein